MKSILLYIILLFTGCLYINAQVGIGTDNPRAITALDMQDTNKKKGFIGPKVSLTSASDQATIPSPAEGLLIYNTATVAGQLSPGYYYWYVDVKDDTKSRWIAWGEARLSTVVTTGVMKSILGYDPVGRAADAPPTITVGSKTLQKVGCVQWEKATGGNGHWYCPYINRPGLQGPTWQESFAAAKQVGGYLVTITTLQEWNFIYNRILANGYTLGQGFWMGYSKVKYPGSLKEFIWITGEESKILWSNASTTEHYFAAGEPNDVNTANSSLTSPQYVGHEGCVHIWSSTGNPSRQWNDAQCNYTDTNLGTIIEFEQ